MKGQNGEKSAGAAEHQTGWSSVGESQNKQLRPRTKEAERRTVAVEPEWSSVGIDRVSRATTPSVGHLGARAAVWPRTGEAEDWSGRIPKWLRNGATVDRSGRGLGQPWTEAAEDRNDARRGQSPKIVEWQRAQTENWGSRRVEKPSGEHWRGVAGDSQSTEATEQWRCRAPD